MEVYTFQRTRDFGIRRYADPEEACDAQIFPVVKAPLLGLKVESVEVPLIYPESQRENETTDDEIVRAAFLKKRDYQRMGFISETLHFIRFLSYNKNIRRKSLLVHVNIS